MADYRSRMDFVVLDELGYLPVAQSGGLYVGPVGTQNVVKKVSNLLASLLRSQI